ncbi:MAG: wax ester/triacylglycerol synthase family O-acyltransferase [Jatrophihabitans sp.]
MLRMLWLLWPGRYRAQEEPMGEDGGGATPRLGVLDAEFFDLEDDAISLHIGAVAVFAGPAPEADELTGRYLDQVRQVPALRRHLRRGRLGLTAAQWVDDPAFDIEYHLPRLRLPGTGGDDELEDVVGRIMSFRLDETRPPWEAWIVEGLDDGRWAIITKLHHSMVDGLAGMAVFESLLDHGEATGSTERGPQPAGPARHRPRPLRTLTRPRVAIRGLEGLGRGALRLVGAARPVPRTSLVGALHGPRSYRTAVLDEHAVDRLARRWAATRNDIVLATVTGAFRRLLLSRGEPAGPHTVRCLVPVAVRHDDAGSAEAGNHVSAILLDLPVDRDDAGDACGAVIRRMREAKEGHEALAGEAAQAVASLLPPALVLGAVRAARRLPHQVLTTVVTNVPGPPTVPTLLGRRLLRLSPYVPIAEGIRIGVAVTRYDGRMTIGVTADRDSTPDLAVFVQGVHDSFADLLDEAAGHATT